MADVTDPDVPGTPTVPPLGDRAAQANPVGSPPALSRRRRIVAVSASAVVLAGILGATLTWSQPQDDTPRQPDRALGTAPAFELEDLRDSSRTLSLDDYRGQWVVINFWASWCVPCRREMPALQSVSRKLKSRVAFVGINHQDIRREALDLLAQTHVTYPVGYDPDGGVARDYGLIGLPTTVLVSPKGDIVVRHTGELARRQLLDLVESRSNPQS